MPDTIFAMASGAGRAGVAIIRVSGPAAGRAWLQLTHAAALPKPRRAILTSLYHPQTHEQIDQGLGLWFPAPRSYTGEDVLELHIHGGRAVIAGLLCALAAVCDLRPAEPGEFTRRAFQNGKLDLTAAEGLADLVNADTEAQRRQSLRQMAGALGGLYESWRSELIRVLAQTEAYIDFPDEDIPASLAAEGRVKIDQLISAITSHLQDDHRGERLRDGLSVVILGPPNAGKSSLLNLLARREAAIVSATAGTTRDIVEIHLDLGGYPVIIADTAGLRETSEIVEQEGVRRALARAADADLKILVLDATIWPEADASIQSLVGKDTLVLVNKIDQRPLGGDLEIRGQRALPISIRTGQGVDDFLSLFEAKVGDRLDTRASPAITRERHRLALLECRECLSRFHNAAGIELAAEDLRLAVRALGRITGRVDVEDILDVVFAEFCIGK
ncbi:MAG TPA: tRNA uridine-5-carboxymethylaminomethyl(34) synthesis GTPase MnmE [Candidatus Cybelea sp.]|nr:tRNA uridine-5-carboxymethylaminomethyl(34) synthesis GTPase MnmE [Candidatus Cybelea sp.]